MDSTVRPSLQERYQAGDLLIDVGRQQVKRGDAEIPLPRLSFDLLVALAKEYPRMQTIDQLMDTVWSPAIVNPETVGQRVKLLRQSLGDDPGHPRYVVGIRGRGYRMGAPVTPWVEPHQVPGQASASAGAWALLAAATIWKFDVRAPNPTPEACASARSAANRALELGPTLSQTHRAKGIALQSCDGDLDGARAEFDRALQLQPDDPLLLMSQARLAAEMRQPDRSIEFARRATAVDPLNPWTFSALGDVNLNLGHLPEAELAYRKAIQINPSLAYNHSALVIALLTDHKPIEAVAESDREPDTQYRLMVQPIALDAAGRNEDAEQALEELKLRYGEENADWVALFYACRHDSDHAIHWLRSYLARHKRLLEYQPYLMNCFNNLAQDPRYQELRLQGNRPQRLAADRGSSRARANQL